MDIRARTVDAGKGSPGTICRVKEILANALAHVLQKLQIKCCGHHVLRGVGHSAGTTNQALRKALGTVLIVGAGQADRGHRLGEMEAIINQVGHLRIGNLADQIRPRGVIRFSLCKHTRL